jgi:Helix-turn-helix domain
MSVASTSYEPVPNELEQNTLILEDQSLRYGFVQLPKQILYARNISRDAKMLYAILLGYAWEKDQCFPGYKRLCEDMQASENFVRKCMRELEAAQLLKQKRRGLGKTNIYTLTDLRTARLERGERRHNSRTSPHEVLEPSPDEVLEPHPTHDKVETVEIQTEGSICNSNIRKADKEENDYVNRQNTEQGSEDVVNAEGRNGKVVQASNTANHRTVETTETQKNSARAPRNSATNRPSPQPVYDENRELLLAYIRDFAKEFRDTAKLRSSVSRAYNLYKQSGLSIDPFITIMYEARLCTKERTGSIKQLDETGLKSRMAYFFAVLEDRLGLRATANLPT